MCVCVCMCVLPCAGWINISLIFISDFELQDIFIDQQSLHDSLVNDFPLDDKEVDTLFSSTVNTTHVCNSCTYIKYKTFVIPLFQLDN